jgi:outer membrane receptor for ferrienterochelin and colicins
MVMARNNRLLVGLMLGAHLGVAQAHTADVQEVLVTGVKERLYQAGMLKDTIEKTEVVSADSIAKQQAENLTDAIGAAAGVRVNNECSMCGVKRVMLNGLRGEHTTVLVDGIPTHSIVSSVYGLDAIGTAGIERIEIARGAGASLTAPEAIGGTINLITKEAYTNELDVDVAAGEDAYKKLAAVGTLVANDESTRITAIAQKDARDQIDGDKNGVSESPLMDNQSVTLRVSQDIGVHDNLTVRGNYVTSELFGGPMNTSIGGAKSDYFADPEYSSAQLFIDDDVRNNYIAKPWETTEWIKTTRNEFAGSWLHESDADLNFTLATSFVQHKQQSFYEGFIYDADNNVRYLDGRINYAFTDNQHLTIGVNNRQETLRSTTNSSSEQFISDSFDYASSGIYLQDTWTANSAVQIAFAVRADKLVANFIDEQKPGEEISQTLVSPRVDMRVTHSAAWNSRLSLGQGYRAPLSFFESDHGILDGDQGFNIAIDRLERSKSVNYALNFQQDRITATSSFAYTQVQHLAQLSSDENDVPALGQLNSTAAVMDYDVALTYKYNEHLSLSGIAEIYNYNAAFEQAFTVAPIEQRLGLSADIEWNDWDTFLSAEWIGARDLTAFATPANPTFDAQGLMPKSTHAPSYWSLDIQTTYAISDGYKIYVGAKNLLNYTQVRDMQTPLYYEAGGFDVNHVYGPLRGREAYVGLKCTF